MTEPEQPDFRKLWRELQDECQREGNGAAVQLLQRAFEERERKLREALEPFALAHHEGVAKPHSDRPEYTTITMCIAYFERAAQALKETPDAG